MKEATRARKRAARMLKAIESGEPYRDIAKRFGVKPVTVTNARKRWGLPERPKRALDTYRDVFIREQLLAGESLQQVADALDITRERVRQIANRIGVDIEARRLAARTRRAGEREARKVDVTCGGCGAVMRLSPSDAIRLYCSQECLNREFHARPTCSHGHIVIAWNHLAGGSCKCRACNSAHANPNPVSDTVTKYDAQLALHNAGWLVEVTGANRITASRASKSVTASRGMGSPWNARDRAGRHLGYATTAAGLLELAEHAWQDLADVRQHAPTVAPFATNGHPKSDESFA